MSFRRTLERKQLKEKWKAFKKANRQYKFLSFAEFQKLWKASMLEQKRQAAHLHTEEEEAQMEELIMEDFEEELNEDSSVE